MKWYEWLVFILGVAVGVVLVHFFGWALPAEMVGVCLFILLVVRAARSV